MRSAYGPRPHSLKASNAALENGQAAAVESGLDLTVHGVSLFRLHAWTCSPQGTQVLQARDVPLHRITRLIPFDQTVFLQMTDTTDSNITILRTSRAAKKTARHSPCRNVANGAGMTTMAAEPWRYSRTMMLTGKRFGQLGPKSSLRGQSGEHLPKV